ncbi:MAG TPA: hypothetical protein DCM31_05660, partial [Deferribacteraceae bacterium]|nr:hypothetical protein [Deferribacteraceae bacterium]
GLALCHCSAYAVNCVCLIRYITAGIYESFKPVLKVKSKIRLYFDCSEITDMYDAVSAGLLTDSQEEKLIHELADYLTDNRIIFADAYLTNVLLQKTGQNSYRLVIIDGLGLRKRDIKSWLHLHVGIINRIRVKRQAERIISRYFMLKAELADNKDKK